jgi:3-hydroxy-9,10-secoandrosta-1,3,5(10)-triene-9,17-dione monooxygenase reductase component
MRVQSATTIEPKALRTALGAFATGVTIVTTRDAGGSDVGLTANSFSSVSLNPPMVLWSLAKTSSSIEAFRNAGHFAVHILSADQDNLSGRFASKGIDKFADVKLERGPGEVPLLGGCTARFECRTAFQYEGGDHVIFVGEVVNLTHSQRPPLIFHGGRYGMVIKKEAVPSSPASDLESSLSPDDLIYHVSRAFYQIRHEAQEERKRRGWTDPEYAALVALGRENGRTVAEIDAMSAFRGRNVTPEVVASLAKRGLVAVAEPIRNDSPVELTPAGRQALIEIIAILKSAEADALEGFDFSEIHLLKQLLRRIVEKNEPAPASAAGQAH